MKFEKQFVHCMYDEELVGKLCVFADSIPDLKNNVEQHNDASIGVLQEPNLSPGTSVDDLTYPFYNSTDSCYRYVYYDPNIKEYTQRTRRMTNKELARWLAEGKGQKMEGSNKHRYCTYAYNNDDDLPCRDSVKIRAWDEEYWHEPLVEVQFGSDIPGKASQESQWA